MSDGILCITSHSVPILLIAKLNSSPFSAAYMRRWTLSALVQIVACRLNGPKPLSKPVLTYCQFSFKKMRLNKWWPFCPGGRWVKHISIRDVRSSYIIPFYYNPLRWRHNDRDSVSNHQPHDCLLNRLFRRRSKETWKLRVTGLCVGNSPGTGEFPAQRATNAENVSIWWRHHLWRFVDKHEVTEPRLVNCRYLHIVYIYPVSKMFCILSINCSVFSQFLFKIWC